MMTDIQRADRLDLVKVITRWVTLAVTIALVRRAVRALKGSK